MWWKVGDGKAILIHDMSNGAAYSIQVQAESMVLESSVWCTYVYIFINLKNSIL